MTDANKGLSILIVEDNAGDKNLLMELLKASVIKIHLSKAANTLCKAIESLKNEIFDIILLDLTLPDSSGIQTFKSIKEFTGRIPVIILTGLSDMNLAIEAISLGAQDYHIKGELDQRSITKTILYSIERKRRLEDLLESKERYITISKAELDLMNNADITRKIMNGSLDAIICIDVFGKINIWNPQAEKIFGWKQHEMLGQSLTETIIPVEYRDRHREGMKHYLSTGEGPILNKLVEITAVNSEGIQFPVELTIIPLTENGNQFFCAFLRDISERKKAEDGIRESEEKYRTLVEHASDGIVISGIDGVCIDANNTICSMLGYSKEELRNIILFKLVKLEKGDVPFRIDEVLAGKSILQERNILKKNGDTLPAELSSKMISDDKILVIIRDITQRKKIENDLRKSNERNDIVAKATSDVIWDWDLESGKVYRSNDGLKKVYGFDDNAPIEMVKDWNLQVHPDDREMITALIEEIKQPSEQTTFSAEYRFLRQDGDYAHVFDRGYIIRDINGIPVRMIGAAQDITERKKAEDNILKNEEKFRDLIDNISDLICTHDLDGRILSVNKASEKLIGIKFNPQDNMNIKNLLTEDTRDRFSQYITEVQKNGFANGLMKIKTRSGDIRIWEYRNTLKTIGVDSPIVRGHARDITERKKAQELIEMERALSDSIINSLPGIFYLFDSDRNFLRWNKNFETVSGYSIPELHLIKPIDFFEDERKEFVKENMDKIFEQGSSSLEANFVTKNGSKIPYYFTGIRISYDGKVCMIGVGIDISDRKKVEQDLEESYASIRNLSDHLQNIREEERTHIAREIHDELGQQLTVIKMDLSWINKKIGIENDPVNSRMKELLVMLDETVKSVRRISTDLRPSLLDDLGLEAAIEWHLSEFEKRFNVKTQFKQEDEEIILSEHIKIGLFRILQESLTNVARHANAKKVLVTLSWEKDSVVLSVVDNGVGINSQNVVGKKTLGILGMKERAEMMGGKYEINGNPGKGTSVIVSIPLTGNSNI